MRARFSEKINRALLILKESLRAFKRDNYFEKSAAFAFYGFFALIPLLLLVIYFLGNFVVSSQTAIKAVESIASQILPEAGKVITKEITSLSRHKKVWGGLTVLTLFWSITPLVSALRKAFSGMFRVNDTVHFLKAQLLDAVAVLVLLILFTLLVLSELFYSMIIGTLAGAPLPIHVLTSIASVLLMTLFMSVFYRAFAPIRLKIADLLAGSFCTAVLWAIMKPVFSLFLKINPGYGVAFGSLKAIFILLVWVYYLFALILLGGEIIAQVRKNGGAEAPL